MELGLTGTGGLAARADEFAGVRRNVELRPIRGLDEAARVGLRPVEPSREGLLGVEAAVEVLRLGDVAFPAEGLPLLFCRPGRCLELVQEEDGVEAVVAINVSPGTARQLLGIFYCRVAWTVPNARTVRARGHLES